MAKRAKAVAPKPARAKADRSLPRELPNALQTYWWIISAVASALSQSPSDSAQRSIAPAPRRRQGWIVLDRGGSGRCSSRYAPVQPESLRNFARLRHAE